METRQAQQARHFLSLNGSLRAHRLLLVLRLIRAGHLGRGFVSFPAGDPRLFRTCFAKNVRLNGASPLAKDLWRCMPGLLRQLPLVVDQPMLLRADITERPRVAVDAYEDIVASHYAESYFSIVTESEFGFGGKARFTEKICKPIVNLHPFVLLGSPGMLAELRRLGFQTFEPFIDEGYDAIRDPWTRLEAVFRQIDALCGMSLRQLDEWYRALLPRLLHNRRHLFVQGRRTVFGLHHRLALALSRASASRLHLPRDSA